MRSARPCGRPWIDHARGRVPCVAYPSVVGRSCAPRCLQGSSRRSPRTLAAARWRAYAAPVPVDVRAGSQRPKAARAAGAPTSAPTSRLKGSHQRLDRRACRRADRRGAAAVRLRTRPRARRRRQHARAADRHARALRQRLRPALPARRGCGHRLRRRARPLQEQARVRQRLAAHQLPAQPVPVGSCTCSCAPRSTRSRTSPARW